MISNAWPLFSKVKSLYHWKRERKLSYKNKSLFHSNLEHFCTFSNLIIVTPMRKSIEFSKIN